MVNFGLGHRQAANGPPKSLLAQESVMIWLFIGLFVALLLAAIILPRVFPD